MERFVDRMHAGEQLAALVQQRGVEADVVVALPPGGVLVAEPVAATLRTPLQVIDVQEVVANRPDLGVGAVTSTSQKLRKPAARSLGLSDREAEDKAGEQQQRLRDLMAQVDGSGGPDQAQELPLEDARVVVVDEGLSVTAGAAEAADQLRARGASHLVLAVPVGITGFLEALGEAYDDVVSVAESAQGLDLDQWYQDLPPVTDHEVVDAVERSQRRRDASDPIRTGRADPKGS